MSARLELDSRLDLRASEALAEALRERRGADLVIDAGAVDHLGAHALQTLLIAAKSWGDDGYSFRCENLSSAARNQLAVFGVGTAALSSGPSA